MVEREERGISTVRTHSVVRCRLVSISWLMWLHVTFERRAETRRRETAFRSACAASRLHGRFSRECVFRAWWRVASTDDAVVSKKAVDEDQVCVKPAEKDEQD